MGKMYNLPFFSEFEEVQLRDACFVSAIPALSQALNSLTRLNEVEDHSTRDQE